MESRWEESAARPVTRRATSPVEMGRCSPSGFSSASERQAAHSSRRFAGSVPEANAPLMTLANLVSSC